MTRKKKNAPYDDRDGCVVGEVFKKRSADIAERCAKKEKEKRSG